MPRRRRDPAPFWWSARRTYYLQVGVKQVRLSADLEEAKLLFHKILADRPADGGWPGFGSSELGRGEPRPASPGSSTNLDHPLPP